MDKATFKEVKVYGTDGVPDMEQLVADITEVLAGCNVEWLGAKAWRYKGYRKHAKPISQCAVQWRREHVLVLDQGWGVQLNKLAVRHRREFPRLLASSGQ